MELSNPVLDSAKRKRSPSISGPAPKTVKTTHHLSINYLARQSPEDLPLINKEDTLPNLLHLLSAYQNILDRHESLASNLGARPLGPNLIKRFERCFESPPKVVTSHHKGNAHEPGETTPSITWLEVIEFARSHPAQFTLSTFSEGRRVCQFYYPQKQLRVQVSEEDFLFINSGRCQELIPPLPIWEDEEKEVGTVDVLEARLKEITNIADTVAARTRQLSHRLKTRRTAILERRAEGGSGTPAKAGAIQTTTAPLHSINTNNSAGFNAVNATNGRPAPDNTDYGPASSAAVRSELLRIFESLPHNRGQFGSTSRNQSIAAGADLTGQAARSLNHAINNNHLEGAGSAASSLSPVPTSNMFPNDVNYGTPDHSASRSYGASASQGFRSSSTAMPNSNAYSPGHAPIKHNFSRPLAPDLENSQPFRPVCQAHMDSLAKGARVVPPCDRCRRLRMDCVKNLTSCQGCTKKHARCHWRDVSREELSELDQLMESAHAATEGNISSSASGETAAPNGYVNGYGDHGQSERNDESEDDDSNPLEDLEALAEKEEEEHRRREAGSVKAEPQAIHQPHADPDEACATTSASANTTARELPVSDRIGAGGEVSSSPREPLKIDHSPLRSSTPTDNERTAAALPTTNGAGKHALDEIAHRHHAEVEANSKSAASFAQAPSPTPPEHAPDRAHNQVSQDSTGPVQPVPLPHLGGFRPVNEK